MSSRIRALAFVAAVVSVLLLSARPDGAFQLQVTVTQGTSSETFTAVDEGAGDLATGSNQNGFLTVMHAFVRSNGATIDLNTTIGTSKPQAQLDRPFVTCHSASRRFS
jgi:hypothetical protein